MCRLGSSGTKYMIVTVELDRLLEAVAAIAGEEAAAALRLVTTVLIAVSLALGLLVLTVPNK